MTALSALTATTTLSSGDLLYVVDGSDSRKITYLNLLNGLTITESQISDLGSYITWATAVDSNVVPDGDSTRDWGSNLVRWANGYTDNLYVSNGFIMTEAADHPVTPVATLGQLWVRNDTPNALVFTDDTGADNDLITSGTGSTLTAATPVLADTLVFFDDNDSDNPKSVVVSDFLTDIQTSTSLGTVTTGTETLDFANGPVQRYINNGAHTLAPPASGEGVITLEIENESSAGAVTTSGFTSVTGDALDTTDNNVFLCRVIVINSRSYLDVVAASGNV